MFVRRYPVDVEQLFIQPAFQGFHDLRRDLTQSEHSVQEIVAFGDRKTLQNDRCPLAAKAIEIVGGDLGGLALKMSVQYIVGE